jgi:putative spermidine/putrescine transport system ATP-binding protein
VTSDRQAAPAGGRIELRSVTKRYGRERVVDAVSALIQPGEFFSLLGPSGSGKTTTLMMIAGFADIDEGSVWVDAQDLSSSPPQRRGFGMVFQNYAIFPHLDVFENVAFPLRARRLPEAEIRTRVQAALELVRLDRFADRFSRQLSGGQQQRVAIARAIVFQPRVVLMDEPLGALDKNLRYQMQVEIKQIQRRLGMTVVYVTHDQEEAMNMSDRIAIMNNGRIEQVGEPAFIYENPSNEFVARFLGEANLVKGVVDSVDGPFGLLRLASGQRLRARVAASSAWQAGEAASFFIRPERLVLISDAQAPAHETQTEQLRGKVLRTSFLGNILRHDVEVDDAAVMTVDEPNASGRAPVAAGDRVCIAWRSQDAVFLKA